MDCLFTSKWKKPLKHKANFGAWDENFGSFAFCLNLIVAAFFFHSHLVGECLRWTSWIWLSDRCSTLHSHLLCRHHHRRRQFQKYLHHWDVQSEQRHRKVSLQRQVVHSQRLTAKANMLWRELTMSWISFSEVLYGHWHSDWHVVRLRWCISQHHDMTWTDLGWSFVLHLDRYASLLSFVSLNLLFLV